MNSGGIWRQGYRLRGDLCVKEKVDEAVAAGGDVDLLISSLCAATNQPECDVQHLEPSTRVPAGGSRPDRPTAHPAFPAGRAKFPGAPQNASCAADSAPKVVRTPTRPGATMPR